MLFIWIILFLLLIICWLLFSPFEFQVDTRVPQAYFKWRSIGTAQAIYENEMWILRIRVLFFSGQWELEKLIFRKKKNKKVKKAKHRSNKRSPLKFLNLIKSFRVLKWELAIDTNDSIKNAWLYPLNFVPFTRQHLFVNFSDENYLFLVIRNAPWKVVYALLR